ncbi:MAG: UDP-N-acetylmuramate dehydrogenase [Acidobacteriota bacterium]|jgi:UDP-N-acetylmuramate dehydrogenase|nr:UDP-N-acetylmuramate dehydrogenase [Acidobacteriota bacterium]
MELQQNVPLAPLTTIGIGGPARFFFRAATVDDVRAALAWAAEHAQPVFILGGGSNLLIADAGFDGLVLQVDLRGIVVESEDPESVMVKAAAGEPWDPFVAYTVDRAWAGVECLSGIPGSTGATPIQNVGAYGQDVSETIARVEVLDRTTDRVVWFTNAECRFGYRASLFKNIERERYIVLSVTFRLRRNGAATVKYPELRKYLEEQGVALADLPRVREAVIAIRKRKGMVIDPGDPDTRSDGSFFMNPILTADDYARFAVVAPEAPHFPGDEPGTIKLSAAWLIEHAGFHKGFVHGNVGLSSKHSLAVINRGGGTAAEVVELVQMIQGRVREQFGVEIHPEPNFIGAVN